MTGKNDLFALVQSLDKNEKRHFRLSATFQKGSKNYTDLFDALLNEKAYDEKKFRFKHKDKNFIKNFAFNKIHLFNRLISSLADYGFERTVDGKMQAMIAECRILFRKEMFRRYFKAIARAKEFAYKHERFGYLLQIIDIEKLIIPKELIYSDKSEELRKEAKLVTAKINNIMEYSAMAGKLLKDFRYFGMTRNIEREALLKKLSNTGIMSSVNNCISSRAAEAYWRVKEIAGNITGRNNEMYEALKQRLRTVSENPYPFTGYIMDYHNDILVSLAECSIKMDVYDDAMNYVNQLNEYNNTRSDKDQTVLAAFLEFKLNLKCGRIKKAVSFIPRLEKMLDIYKGKLQIDTEFAIMFYIAAARIEEKKFHKALDAVNRLLVHPLLNKKSDYECYIRILNLIVHFELKNYDLLRHLVLSTYRYLSRHEKLFKTELVILDFLRKMPEVKNDDDLKYYFKMFSGRLQKLKNDKYERNAFEYFDLLKWVSSKINKQ